MKKLILVLFAAVLTAFTAAASEDAVKQAVIREYEMIRDGKFSEMLPLYTKDYSSISASKRKTTYKDIQIMSLMLDGKHPEEFMLFITKAKSAKDPSPDEEKQLRKIAQNEWVKSLYAEVCGQMRTVMRKTSEISLKTMKFISVKVNGNQAEVVCEYEELDPVDTTFTKTVKRTSITRFRKENGIWKNAGSTQK
ncbi:MAG: hypothetical protein IKB25_09985 [Lentisphaeria bacterium]|nr:hypothetical protein [Lentisphaeria bacterium]